jgi:glucuronate isomerase
LPKFNTYRRVLAKVLADDFVRPGTHTETEAIDLGRLVLRGNVERVFNV